MTNTKYRKSDLMVLLDRVYVSEWHSLSVGLQPAISSIGEIGKAFTRLGAGKDLPPLLQQFYGKIGNELMQSDRELNKILKAAMMDYYDLFELVIENRKYSTITSDELKHLRYVDDRLRELEVSIKSNAEQLQNSNEKINPPGVQWDKLDPIETILHLGIKLDPERPSYFDDDEREMVAIKFELMWYEGLNDGESHGVYQADDGSSFECCLLFRLLCDEDNVGIDGMLNLQSIWLEVITHHSGMFEI